MREPAAQIQAGSTKQDSTTLIELTIILPPMKRQHPPPGAAFFIFAVIESAVWSWNKVLRLDLPVLFQ